MSSPIRWLNLTNQLAGMASQGRAQASFFTPVLIPMTPASRQHQLWLSFRWPKLAKHELDLANRGLWTLRSAHERLHPAPPCERMKAINSVLLTKTALPFR